MPKEDAAYFRKTELPSYANTPLIPGRPLFERRIAIVSTAGLYREGDRPFRSGDGTYRVIDGDTAADELIMGQLSLSFDRTGFQQDANIVFPIDRLRELADERVVGSVASAHYSFMGAMDPAAVEPYARDLAGLLKADNVDGVILVPV